MSLNFSGRNVLITGGAMGIGKGLSERFAQEGANIALVDLLEQQESLKAWASELEDTYAIKTWTFSADLTDMDGPDGVYEQVTRHVGEVHTLVNNAGICWFGNFREMPPDRLERMILLNCLAYAKLSRLFLSAMVEKNEGAILNVSSVSAFQPVPKMAVYAATKAFTQSLTEAVRSELPLGSKVTVSTLNPPFTRTSLIGDAGVPLDFVPLLTSFMDVSEVTRAGLLALKKGKVRYVPGLFNKFMYLYLVKYAPAKVLSALTWVLCNRLTDLVPDPVVKLYNSIRKQGGENYV